MAVEQRSDMLRPSPSSMWRCSSCSQEREAQTRGVPTRSSFWQPKSEALPRLAVPGSHESQEDEAPCSCDPGCLPLLLQTGWG